VRVPCQLQFLLRLPRPANPARTHLRCSQCHTLLVALSPLRARDLQPTRIRDLSLVHALLLALVRVPILMDQGRTARRGPHPLLVVDLALLLNPTRFLAQEADRLLVAVARVQEAPVALAAPVQAAAEAAVGPLHTLEALLEVALPATLAASLQAEASLVPLRSQRVTTRTLAKLT
jgi:hypothetical protein